MATELVRLPYDIVSGAQVSFTHDVTVNPSEAGIAGRIAYRPIKREFMLSVGPTKSDELMSIVMTMGQRYPFAIRDYTSYILDDEEITYTGTTAFIGKTWAPATGNLSVFERILYVDQEETPFVVKVNGVTLNTSPAEYTLTDFGRIEIPTLVESPAMTVTVSGHYMVPVCIVDAPATSIITNSSGQTLHRFSDIRLEQIYEAELEKLLA